MAENLALLDAGASFVHMQIGAADIRGGDLYQDIGGRLDAGIRHLLHADLAWSFIIDGFHWQLLQYG
jgi:hypothetical protein